MYKYLCTFLFEATLAAKNGMKFGRDIHGASRMNPNNFGDLAQNISIILRWWTW